ncbi:MAG: hypothetical protein KDM81_00505 [Verrucomicrobiae bacterium]|nr:hypothetical protein [Verrucomicrobiae bacterium]MCP5527018.1 hypothetical protein [Verrucomicrobiales bacterium]
MESTRRHPLGFHLCLRLAASGWFLLPLLPAAQAADAKLARPSPQQYAWHEQERIMFACLDPATWQGREYDNHSTPLSAINPTPLDTDQ